jgi:flavin-dependent dehydrogenase
MKTIKILGAGISGLTAAINLAKEGYDVEVNEKFSDVGKSHRLNFEGLDNRKNDVKKMLKKINVKIDFKNKSFKEIVWYSPSFRKAVLKSKKPFFYLVERGGKDSLEYSLKKQALNLGVKFKFNTKLKDAEIISTGPKIPMGVGFGTFYNNVKFDDNAIGILSNKIAPHGYFYILVWNNRASVCTTISKYFGKFKVDIRKLHMNNLKIDFCKKILSGARFKHTFSGFMNFKIPRTAVINGKIYTGEAAGFQDAFLGFGMNYAFLSGYFAAKSIIESIPYDKMWKDCFLEEQKRSIYRRFLLNLFGDALYEKVIENLRFKTHLNWEYKILYQIPNLFFEMIKCKNSEQLRKK